MKVINTIYLLVSSIIVIVLLYAILNNMINYHLEDSAYYLNMALRYMVYFLIYVIINIIYLTVILLRNINN